MRNTQVKILVAAGLIEQPTATRSAVATETTVHDIFKQQGKDND